MEKQIILIVLLLSVTVVVGMNFTRYEVTIGNPVKESPKEANIIKAPEKIVSCAAGQKYQNGKCRKRYG